MPREQSIHFPPQKLSASMKTEEWGKKCVDAGEDLAIFRYVGIRESYTNKLTNYNLANDILDTEDIEKVCNPMGIKEATFPAKMQNYPIANPKIDLLVGEDRKRKFDWQVRVINDDAISEKEEAKKEQLIAFFTEKIQQQGWDEEKVKKELQELDKFLNYEWQDLRERTASHILKYLYRVLDLKDSFSRGFEDALIAGEEIYCGDIVGGEPILRRCNPLNIHTVRSGESPYIEDSDIIVEDGYQSPGMVIDNFYDHLTPAQVKEIDDGTTVGSQNTFINIGQREESIVLDGLIDVGGNTSKTYGAAYDTEGNIRVIRVVWRSLRKVGKLTYYDEDGMPQEMIVGETYKVDKEAGEEIKWLWINEWWEGTRIGKSIYVKIQPRPIQFRSMTNLSKCGPGYVGLAYNINSSKAKSLMDRMKPYQYLYNVFMYRTELAFARSKGKIAKMDLSRVPDNWTVDKWMYYAEVHGWAVEDPFKEAKKGVAQGKLAGQMGQSAPVLDLDMGNYIQQNIQMLGFIEQQLGKIAGVSDQRQGQVENRELVGNVERAVTQSSHITEKWFALHASTKVKALSVLLETAKHAWRDEKDKRIQFILDDLSTTMLNIQGEQFNECDYGVLVTDGASDAELLSTMKQLAHAGIQNDKINFSQLIDIYMTDSMGSMRRKIERAEIEKAQRESEQMKQQQEMQQQQLAQAKEIHEDTQAHEIDKLHVEYGYKIQIEEMKLMDKDLDRNGVDDNDNGVNDIVDAEKVRSAERIKQQEVQSKEKIAEQQRQHEARENAKDRENKLQIAKSKPRPAKA